MRAPKSLLTFLLVAMICAGQEARDSNPLAPSSTSTPPSEFASAELLLRQGKYDEAIAELQNLAAKIPAPKNIARELGAAYYKKGDYLKAAEHLKTAQSEDPKDNESIQLLGLSYYLAGRPADAIPYLEKVQSWFPRANVDAAYILGICYIQSKDYPKARTAFAHMFDVPADSAASYLFTARMLLRQEFDPVAEEYAQKATTLDPKLPGAHLMLGELYLYKSRVPEAIEVVLVSPRNPLNIGAREHGSKGAAEDVGRAQQDHELDAENAAPAKGRALAELPMERAPQRDIRQADENQEAPPNRDWISPIQPVEAHRTLHFRHQTCIRV